MSSPFTNPFQPGEPEPMGNPTPPPGADPSFTPYNAPNPHAGPPVAHGYGPRPPKPVMPIQVMIAIGLGLFGALAAFLVPIFNKQGVLGFAFWWILALVGAVLLIALAVRPGNESRIAVSILSALWCLTLIGAVVAIPILVLLWLPDDSKRYFARGEQLLR